MSPDSKEQQTPARFADGENDTVIDGARRLLWLKQDTWQMTGKWMNWVQARDYSEELNQKKYGGYQGWRLPTVQEAKSLFDKKQENKEEKSLHTEKDHFERRNVLARVGKSFSNAYNCAEDFIKDLTEEKVYSSPLEEEMYKLSPEEELEEKEFVNKIVRRSHKLKSCMQKVQRSPFLNSSIGEGLQVYNSSKEFAADMLIPLDISIQVLEIMKDDVRDYEIENFTNVLKSIEAAKIINLY